MSSHLLDTETPWDHDVPRDHPAVEAALDHYMAHGWLPTDMGAELLEAGISVVDLINAVDAVEYEYGMELEEAIDLDGLIELVTEGEDDEDDGWSH